MQKSTIESTLIDTKELKAALEAILFISAEVVSPFKLADALDISTDTLDDLILELQEDLRIEDRGLALVKIAGGFRLCTKVTLSKYIDKFTQIQDKKLSQPLMETLSIIAFKQPVTKQEIEEIRGVNTDKMIRRLLERDLIQEVGRKKVIGRPILYGTTALFLQSFGLNDLQDLPELPNMTYEDKRQIYNESLLFEDMEINEFEEHLKASKEESSTTPNTSSEKNLEILTDSIAQKKVEDKASTGRTIMPTDTIDPIDLALQAALEADEPEDSKE